MEAKLSEKPQIVLARQKMDQSMDPQLRDVAIRTAFVARFIVLREGRRSRAHRLIENLTWDTTTTARELAAKFRQAFIENGDKLQPVDRDIIRALKHAERSAGYFIEEYLSRASTTFTQALFDYERSNSLLFGGDPESVPRTGGWRLPSTIDNPENDDSEDEK